ncbi:MAG: LemA family protein [Cocleimonas sp.]|nr:LemA family protein [Cocleimonas sp.]
MSKLVAIVLAVITISLILGVGVYNRIISGDEGVIATWSEVVNQYQRRADLIPNLVSTVKGAAANEKDILNGVVEARAKATSIQVTPETLNDPAMFQKFSQAQDQLSGALSRLLVTVERYPEVKSTKLYQDLLAQLEGTENRITVARKRYVGAVKDYNLTVRKFPGSIIAGFTGNTVKPNFSVANEAEISKPPAVDFNTAPATN